MVLVGKLMPSWFHPLLLNEEQKTISPTALHPGTSPFELISGWRQSPAWPESSWESAHSSSLLGWGMGHPVEGLLHLQVVLGRQEVSGERGRAFGELVQLLEWAG